MKKKNLMPLNGETFESGETSQNETNEFNNSVVENSLNRLAMLQEEFLRLSNLFKRKEAFLNSLEILSNFHKKLVEDVGDLEAETCRLTLSTGYNREDLKINNKAVILEAINFLKDKINSVVLSIDEEILVK